MANLTETAYYARKSVNWFFVAMIVYIIAQFFFGVVLTTIRRTLPKAQLKPDNALGKLQAIQFPQNSGSISASIQYRIGTLDGTIPEASGTAKVYFQPKDKPDLLDITKAKSSAAILGFTGQPVQKSQNIFEWIDTSNNLRRLTMDIISNHLTLTYDFIGDPTVLAEKNISSSKSLTDALDFLRRNSLLPSDIDQRRTKLTPLKLNGATLNPISSYADADAVRVDFFRRAIDTIATVTPNPNKGIISLTLSGSSRADKKIVALEWRYWPVSYQLNGRYGLLKSNDAWNKLQGGQAFIANNPKNSQTITIRNAHLAYYDSYESQLFLQPVFAFEGDDNFVAYVPAAISP